MRISRTLAVTVSGFALVASAAIPAVAAQHHPSTKQFHSTLTPKTVKAGHTLTLKGTGAKKNTSYDCVLVVIKGAAYGADLNTIKSVESTSKGKVTCKQKFEPYTETVGSKSVTCPISKANKKKHYKCGMAVSTIDKKSATIKYFTGKK